MRLREGAVVESQARAPEAGAPTDPPYRAPASAPGQDVRPGDWVAGPPNAQARQATRWTVAGYVLLGAVGPLVDGAEDEALLPAWDPGWTWGMILLGAVVLVTAVAMAWRARSPRPGGRTTGTRRRVVWLVVFAAPPALWGLTMAALLPSL